MARPLTLRIIIADGEQARFVQMDADNTLRTVSSLELGVSPSALAHIGTDRLGRAFESGRPRVTRSVHGTTCMRWSRRGSSGCSANRSTPRRVATTARGTAACAAWAARGAGRRDPDQASGHA